MKGMSRILSGALVTALVLGFTLSTASGALILRLRLPGEDLHAPSAPVEINPNDVIQLEMWALITEPTGAGLITVRAGAMSTTDGIIHGTTTLDLAGTFFGLFSSPGNPLDVDGDGDTDAVDMNWAAMDFLSGAPGQEHLVGVVTFEAEDTYIKGTNDTFILPTLAGVNPDSSQWKPGGNPFGTPTVESDPAMAGVPLVPEPATLALVGLGLAALARRKRK